MGNEKFRYVPGVTYKSNVRMSVLIYLRFVSWLRALDRFLFDEALVARNRFLRFVSRAILERTDRAAGRRLCGPGHGQGSRDRRGINPDDLVSESIALVVAGSGTTLIILAAALLLG